MTGTTFPSGISARKKYNGSTAATDISKVGNLTKLISRQAVIRCSAQTAETQTGFSFPEVAIVKDVFLNVITGDASETVDVGTAGTSNDPDGLLDGASVASVGLVKGSLADGAVTLGALLREEVGTGADVANAKSDCIVAGGDPVTYTCSAGSDTAEFDIVIDYFEVVKES